MMAIMQLNLVANLAHPSFKILHNQSMHKLVMIFLYPHSAGYEDGTLPAGTAKFEKRGPALFVPKWLPENCIQCNQCSFVCPHATIRPILATEAEVAAAPEHFDTIPAIGR